MWEPRLFTTNIPSIDRPSRERAAAGTQDRPKRPGTAGRDKIAEDTARECADNSTARTIPALAVVTSLTVAVDPVCLPKLATLSRVIPITKATVITVILIPTAKARSPITTAPAIVVGRTRPQRQGRGLNRHE
jgi:hypothetical protein